MRCDQYVGLTKSGKEWFNENSKNHDVKSIVITQQAFNPDPLIGWSFVDNDTTYKEEVQLAPWSSGPMYLTRIAIYKNGEKIGTMFDWEEDHEVISEVDYENGKYYI